jgi:hypothetical protein
VKAVPWTAPRSRSSRHNRSVRHWFWVEDRESVCIEAVAFQVIVLTINWTVLIASGVLLSVLFRRRASVEMATRQIRIALASDSGRGR